VAARCSPWRCCDRRRRDTRHNQAGQWSRTASVAGPEEPFVASICALSTAGWASGDPSLRAGQTSLAVLARADHDFQICTQPDEALLTVYLIEVVTDDPVQDAVPPAMPISELPHRPPGRQLTQPARSHPRARRQGTTPRLKDGPAPRRRRRSRACWARKTNHWNSPARPGSVKKRSSPSMSLSSIGRRPTTSPTGPLNRPRPTTASTCSWDGSS